MVTPSRSLVIAATEIYTAVMLQRLKAQARNDADGLDDEERAALHESLTESIEQMKSGQTIDVKEALAELRAHR